MKKRLSAALVGLLLSLGTFAHGFQVGDLKIGHPWARPTVQGQMAGGGFLKVENTGKTADRLISGTTTAAERLELHTMAMEGDVMKMRQVEGIDIPAGATVELKPGSFHVMFMGLKAPMKLGDKVPVTLKFAKAGEVTVEMWVEQPKADAGMGEKAKEHMHH
jgi:periplasmic copper chaperone A